MTETGKALYEVSVTEREQLLDELPPLRRFPKSPAKIGKDFGVPVICYTFVSKVIEEVYRFCEVRISGFCAQNIDLGSLKMLLEAVDEVVPCRIKLYLPDTQLLVVTVPRGPHESRQSPLYGDISFTYSEKMGLEIDMCSILRAELQVDVALFDC